jgi:hypothetical protein
MSTLPVHKELEALARDPFSLNPFTWADVKERIDTLIADAKLDWSEEVIQRERGHVPHMRAHLYVLQLQYIAIRGTNKVMHLLRDAATAATEIGLVEHIQQACHRFEKTREKYDKLHSLLGPAGAPEAHGYFLTFVESRFDDLTAELQRQREAIMLLAAKTDVELARREPNCEDAMRKRLMLPPPPDYAYAPEETERELKEALDGPPPLPRDDDEDSMALRVVTAYLDKLREDEKEEDEFKSPKIEK